MSNIDQMIENVRVARLTVRNLTEELKAKGIIVHDYDYMVDPATGQIVNLKITVLDGITREDLQAAAHKLHAANVSFGIGSMLRKIANDPDNLAFKLHDFGYRGGENS